MFNGTVVAKMNVQKHWGLKLDSCVSSREHLNEKINSFKDHILSLIRPNIFGIHDHVGLRNLQLRIGLSCLRYHKKCHNFIDNPSDKCLCNHGIEGTSHFLFLCPFFAAQRATLASSVMQILQKYNLNYLENQSHPTVNFADNRKNPFVNNKIHKKLDVFQRKCVALPPPSSTPKFFVLSQSHHFCSQKVFFVSICMWVLYLSLYIFYSLVL